MMPDWICRALASAYPPRDGKNLRKLERVAERMDQRTDSIASALAAISGKLKA